MYSNIFLKSNIYPAKRNDYKDKYEKYILYSDEYLSKIQSQKKMIQIREKHILRSLPRYWTLAQQDFFESGENNPYIGIIVKNGEYIFIRNADIPSRNFIKYNPIDYDYNYSLKNYSLNDLLIKNEDIYNYEDKNKEKIITAFLESEYIGPIIDTENILTAIAEIKNKDAKILDDDVFYEGDEQKQDRIETNVVQTEKTDDKNIFSRFIYTKQKDIIEADPDNVIFVDAGPGTGKTYTLIERIKYLVMNSDVTADEMLILCFTNAAVNEIKERLNTVIKNGGDRSLANVDIRTFHSFAWWLIVQANEQKWDNIKMHDLNYDLSIKIASKIMSNRTYYTQIVGNWSHFIVDEIQDLTNHLARFVLHIVNACLENKKTGITVLGDSCQAIYDYTLRDVNNPMSSQNFYDALVRKTENVGLYYSLIENHRQKDKLSDFSLDYRKAILSQNIDQMQNEVVKISEKITRIDGNYLSVADERMIKKIRNDNNNQKICFVSRNNGQTLRLSSVFKKKGIEHKLNANMTELNFAVWVSEIFYDYNKKYINRDEFVARYNSLVSNKCTKSPEEIWERILYQTKLNDSVYTTDLLRAIGSSKIDDIYFRYINEGSILVSNIHKTKGREYDHVIIDQAFIDDLINRNHEIGEYKTLYVALTRPKLSVYSAQLSDSKNKDVYKIDVFKTKRSRWGRMKYDRVINFELLSDIDICFESFLPKTIQSYLKNIKIGDPIILKRAKENGRILYNILHILKDETTKIGQLQDTFRDDLSARMKLSDEDYINLPDTITDLYVSGKYSYIATDDYLKTHPEISQLSPNGVWQWVEFIGIGLASYDTY